MSLRDQIEVHKQQIIAKKVLATQKHPAQQESKPIVSDYSVDPKIMQSYERQQGLVPRNVAVERKRKQFAQYNLQDLFISQVPASLALATPPSTAPGSHHVRLQPRPRQPRPALTASTSTAPRQPRPAQGILQALQEEFIPIALHYFDDSSFDDYPSEEWIARQLDEDGKVRFLIAKAWSYQEETQQVAWASVLVESYDSQQDVFQVQVVGQEELAYLHRMYFCFDSEDPLKYARRVRQAILSRKICFAHLKYYFIIDMMPRAGLSEMSLAAKTRIARSIKSSKRYAQMGLESLFIDFDEYFQ